MVQTSHLQALRAVLDTGSFAKAGKQLGLTGSGVSQQISALEEALQIPLFERGARSARPTAAAFVLGRAGARVIRQLDAFEQEAAAMRKAESGVVRIGSFPTASARLLPGALARLRERGPGIEVLLDEAEPTDLLLGVEVGSLDLALVYHYDVLPRIAPSSIGEVPLLHEALVLLMHPHAISRGDHPTLAALSDTQWVSSLDGTEGARCLMQLCRASGFSPDLAYRSNDYGVVRGLVAAGLGVALIPALAHMDGPEIVATPLDLPGAGRTVAAIHREGDVNPLVGSCLDVLAEAASDLRSSLLEPLARS